MGVIKTARNLFVGLVVIVVIGVVGSVAGLVPAISNWSADDEEWVQVWADWPTNRIARITIMFGTHKIGPYAADKPPESREIDLQRGQTFSITIQPASGSALMPLECRALVDNKQVDHQGPRAVALLTCSGVA